MEDVAQRTVAPTPSALLEEIGRVMAELHPQAGRLPPVRLDSRLERDLGLDSLSRIELLARLERRFHLVLPEAEGLAAATPAELLRALGKGAPRETVLPAPEPIAEIPDADARQIEVPDAARTLTEVLDWHCAQHGDRICVHFESGPAHGTVLSYAALRERARRVAAGLQALQLKPAEPVALMLPTHPDFLIAFFGTMYAGGVPVPLYPPLRPGELADYWHRQAHILRNCEARILVVDAAMRRHGRLIRGVTGPVERVVTAAELDTAAAPQTAAADADALAMLQYTSGSTADPKGVTLSHRNMLANLRVMGAAIEVARGDVFVSWLPLYHDMGLIGAWLGTLYYGVPLVLMPPQAFLLRPERWLWALHRYRATLSAAPNFALELCVHRIPDDALAGLDLSRWRLCFCGAEPVFPESIERFAERFARFGFRRETLFPVYGLAENTLALTFPPPGRAPKVLRVAREPLLERDTVVTATGAQALTFVSCGAPLSGHEIRVVDEGDHELPDGTQGRIQFRGPSATSGYYRASELTRRLLHGTWLDTGDLGFVHAGELYLTGRVKDLIIRAGRHIHPQAIEQAVGAIPGIRRGRVAAFGSVAGEEGTERLVVVAETRVTQDAQLAALRAQVNGVVEALSGGPADAVVLAPPGSVLKTSSGKLRRSACRSAYEAGTLGKTRTRAMLEVLLRGLRGNLRSRLRRMRALAFAAWAWLLFALLVPVAALAVAALPTLSMRWRAVRACAQMLRAATRVRVTLRQAEPWPDQPCMFVTNHASFVDVYALIWMLPRPVAFAAKSELAARPLLRWLLTRFGAVFVERYDPQRCTDVVARVQTQRRDFLFFPEGTFYRMPGLRRFHLGAFVAAAQAGLPVVPIALRGTRAILRDIDWLPRRGEIEISIGGALIPQPEGDRWHEALRLSIAARRFILEHCGEPDADLGGPNP